MTALALVSGKIWKAPESRVSKAGNAFAIAVMREGASEACSWWSIIAFGDTSGELLQLQNGDAVSVSGPFSIETYTKNGETRLSRKITADRIASPRLSVSARRSAA